jgi:hypothetical protein
MVKKPKKPEFSKLILGGCMILYFLTAVFGGIIVWNCNEAVGELFAYVGAPTAVAIGFYAWKAKAENVLKIPKEQREKVKNAIEEPENIGEMENDNDTGNTDTADSGWSNTDIDSNIPCDKSEVENKRMVKIRRIRGRKDVRERDRSA